MAGFNQMGAVPDFYSQLMQAAQQQLVRMPDGTYQPAPQTPANEPLSTTYGGIIPPSNAFNDFPAYEVGASGSGMGGSSVGSSASGRASIQPLPKQTTRVALGPNGSLDPTKTQDRLNPGTALAFMGDGPGSAALSAIGSLSLPKRNPLPSGAVGMTGRSIPDMQWNSSSPTPLPAGETDPWHTLRFGEATRQRQGMVTANRPTTTTQTQPQQQRRTLGLLDGLINMLGGGGAAPAAAPQAQAPSIMSNFDLLNQQGNYPSGSPNASFEKDNGAGSVTKSMAASSRWNTGY